MSEKPNVLILMVDELRAPPGYENSELKAWRNKYLNAENYFQRKGFSFKNHYTATIACVASRASLFTGEYPSLHGVSQTEGAGKSSFEKDMFWLDPNSVPTMGDYFREGGYQTHYVGKWHISDADILIAGTKDSLAAYENNGAPNIENTNIYKNSHRLDGFGFDGYIGPEPTGNDPLNSGGSSSNNINGRDVIYTEEAINILKDLDNKKDNKPWLLVTSLVNPHDIALYGDITKNNPTFNFDIDPSVPNIPPAPNSDDTLLTKPPCQLNYRGLYQKVFQPTPDTEDHRRLYYSLILKSDKNLQKILSAFKETKFKDNTIIVFMTDHGDQLGSHGLCQKWYTAYQESIHIPFSIKLPKSFKQKEDKIIEKLTSNIDILPTLIGLCKLDYKHIFKKLQKTHYLTKHLVGTDLSYLLLDNHDHHEHEDVILFTNDDNVCLGYEMTTFSGKPYEPIVQPNNIRTIVTKLNGIMYKFSLYFEDRKFWTNAPFRNIWSTPNNNDVKISGNAENNTSVGTLTTVTTNIPANKLYEMYNLTIDPIEMNNLMFNPTPETLKIAGKLKKILKLQMELKLLIPNKEYIWRPNPEINIKAP